MIAIKEIAQAPTCIAKEERSRLITERPSLGAFHQSLQPELCVGTICTCTVECCALQDSRLWCLTDIQGRGNFRDGNISLWEISYFKCVRNFPLNFQTTVRNKPGAKFSIVESFEMRKGLVAAENREELWAGNASTCLPPPCAACLHLHLYWGHTARFFL